MKIYLAPLEGITGYIYRNAYHTFYPDADKYFTPFLAPHTKRSFNSREKNDVLPEHNAGMYTVPQVLSKSGADVAEIAEELKAFGYREININAGCPSGTVVAKGRGAGLLEDVRLLDAFLAEVFAKTDVDVSVKTRIGMDSPEEFREILKVYNQYPLKELIVHPRVREDYYRNQPDWDAFEYAVEHSTNPLVYNGDIFTVEQAREFAERFPTIDTLMLGRGVIADPGLIGKIKAEFDEKTELVGTGEIAGNDRITGEMTVAENDQEAEKKVLKAFHDRLLEDYGKEMSGDRNVLFKMKELWFYLGGQFPGREKQLKKIKKAGSVVEYQMLVNELL